MKNKKTKVNKNTKCLYCYSELNGDEIDFHAACSKKIFEAPVPPKLNYTVDQIFELAEQVVKSQATVTGVQAKLSLHVERPSRGGNEPKRFAIVGLWGRYTLKPATDEYQSMPELEDVTMHLAEIAGISTVPHSLIRLKSGELAYITKRVDRDKKSKLHMEDMCQLTERLTEDKYRGSHEQVGKALLKYSENPGLDLLNYFEQVVFAFLTGNADMHLKNFSMLDTPGLGYTLCPAYDMVASALVVLDDNEELALTLNGKKSNLLRKDFEEAMDRFDIDDKARVNMFNGFADKIDEWHNMIGASFLSWEMQDDYIQLIGQRAKRIIL